MQNSKLLTKNVTIWEPGALSFHIMGRRFLHERGIFGQFRQIFCPSPRPSFHSDKFFPSPWPPSSAHPSPLTPPAFATYYSCPYFNLLDPNFLHITFCPLPHYYTVPARNFNCFKQRSLYTDLNKPSLFYSSLGAYIDVSPAALLLGALALPLRTTSRLPFASSYHRPTTSRRTNFCTIAGKQPF